MGQKMSNVHIAVCVRRASQNIEKIASIRLNPLELTYRQAIVLVAVNQNQGCTQRHLTEVTGVDRTTITSIVNTLKRRRLVTRVRNRKDERSVCVTGTDEGVRRAKLAEKTLSDLDAELRRLVKPDVSAIERALMDLMRHEDEDEGQGSVNDNAHRRVS